MTSPPSARPAAVVFDLDGTLVDTMTSAPAAYADTIRALGGPAVSSSDVVAAWHRGPTSAVLAHFLGRPATVDDLACFYLRFEAAVATARPFPGVVEMVGTLRRAGYRLGVFTSATRRAAAHLLRTTDLGACFRTVICGDEIPEPKPAPAGLRLACRQLGVGVAATTYVGDAEVDLRCAERAGTAAVHARWGAVTTVRGAAPVADRPDDVVALVQGRPARGSTCAGDVRKHGDR